MKSTGRQVLFLCFTTGAFVTLIFQPFPIRTATNDDFGQLVVKHEHLDWPSPESVVRDLRSPDEEVRLKALLLIGVPEQFARRPKYNKATPSEVIGLEVVKAEQIELRYAALGGDENQQAIVSAQVAGTYAFAVIATPRAKGWERVAAASCWCKYDADSTVDSFVSLTQPPDQMRDDMARYELVFRASGGGTGIYRQDEAHFRVYKGELKAVMSFASRVQANPQGIPQPWHLEIERRWFYPRLLISRSDGSLDNVAVLAESRGKTAVPPDVYFRIRELQDRLLNGLSCRAFRWNQKLFQYEPVSVPNVCGSPGK